MRAVKCCTAGHFLKKANTQRNARYERCAILTIWSGIAFCTSGTCSWSRRTLHMICTASIWVPWSPLLVSSTLQASQAWSAMIPASSAGQRVCTLQVQHPEQHLDILHVASVALLKIYFLNSGFRRLSRTGPLRKWKNELLNSGWVKISVEIFSAWVLRELLVLQLQRQPSDVTEITGEPE